MPSNKRWSVTVTHKNGTVEQFKLSELYDLHNAIEGGADFRDIDTITVRYNY